MPRQRSDEINNGDRESATNNTTKMSAEKEKDRSKVHKLSLKGSAKYVAEFVGSLSHKRELQQHLTVAVSILHKHNSVRTKLHLFQSAKANFSSSFQRGVYPAEDFTAYAFP